MAVIEIWYEGDLRTRVINHESGAQILTDAPKDNQGRGEAFSPTDLVGVALASCVLTIMGIEARKLGVDLQGTKAEVKKEMGRAPRKIAKLSVSIRCPHTFDAKIQSQLETAGMACPVHHSLHPEMVQEFFFQWGES